MKKILILFSLFAYILLINSCGGLKVLSAIGQINKSELSAENEIFQQETNIQLIVVKRGLWSMQNQYKNKMIQSYFNKLLNNQLMYSVDNTQNEFAKQIVTENIKIFINGNIFQNYTDFEKEVLLIASTSTLALIEDTKFNKKEIPNMFFKIIKEYDEPSMNYDISGIINSQWYKEKKLILTDNGIILEN